MRAAHNAVAESANEAQASTRPPETTARELRRMREDVLAKLALEPESSVVEIGCGTGIVALPVAERAGRFVGIDFAEKALAVLGRHLQDAGLAHKATLIESDFLAAGDDELAALGTFDRVLAYSVLQYAADDAQAREFILRAVRLARPGGLVMLGNLPLADLVAEQRALGRGSMPARAAKLVRWLASNDTPVPRTATWKLAALPYRGWKKLTTRPRRRQPFTPATVPRGSTVVLTTEKVERWLAAVPEAGEHWWRAPRPGTPMFMFSADVFVRRAGSAL